MSSKLAVPPATEVSCEWTVELTGLSRLPPDRDSRIRTELSQGWSLEHVFHARGLVDGRPFKNPSLCINWPARSTSFSCEIIVSHQDAWHTYFQTRTQTTDCRAPEQPFRTEWVLNETTSQLYETPESFWNRIFNRDQLKCNICIKTRSTDATQCGVLHPYVMRNLLSALNRPIASDVRFDVVSRRRTRSDMLEVGRLQPVYAHSNVLLKSSEHFQKLLHGSFAESMSVPLGDGCDDGWFDEYDYWSDSDLDEEDQLEEENCEGASDVSVRVDALTIEAVEQPQSCSLTAGLEGLTGRVVRVKDTAYLTWKALIFYLQTSSISFAPLTSTGKRQEIDGKNEEEPPKVSPKSMYRLAHTLEMTDLCNLAKFAIDSQITEDNVLSELFSTFSARYPEFRRKQLDMVAKNKGSFTDSPELRRIADDIASGSMPQGPKTLTELFLRLGGADLSVQSSKPSKPSKPMTKSAKKKQKRKKRI